MCRCGIFGKIAGTEGEASKVIADYEQRIQAEKDLGKKQTPLRVAVLRAAGKDVTAETPRAVTASMVEEISMKNVILDHVRNISTRTVPTAWRCLQRTIRRHFIVTMGKMDQITEKLEQEMTGNPAWNQLQAVENGRVYFLSSDLYLLNPGVRLGSHAPPAGACLSRITTEINQAKEPRFRSYETGALSYFIYLMHPKHYEALFFKHCFLCPQQAVDVAERAAVPCFDFPPAP